MHLYHMWSPIQSLDDELRERLILWALPTPHKSMAIELDHQYVSNPESSRILSSQILINGVVMQNS